MIATERMNFQPQREALCVTYGISSPQLPLREIAHWEVIMRSSKSNNYKLHDELCYLAPGFFYMPVSERPTPSIVDDFLKKAQNADWLMVPSLEKQQVPLHEVYQKEIISVPFMKVAYLVVDKKLDDTLKVTMDKKVYKEMLRLTRRTEEHCHTEFHRLDDISTDDKVIKEFAYLQSLNVKKYNHARNLYSSSALKILTNSFDAANYYIKLNYEKHNNIPIYGSLSYADNYNGVFYQLVQGQDRHLVPPGLNLYVSDYYQLYKFADSCGFLNHCLGRGAIDVKIRMGANFVMDLENWLIPINTNRKNEMYNFANMMANKQGI